jgi:hypothetical protein
VVDSYHSHEHPEVQAWLAKNPRIALHFTPTSGSRLNLVKVLFGNQRCLRPVAVPRAATESIGRCVELRGCATVRA